MKQHLIFALANFVFGILLIVLAKVVLPVCHPMDAMTMSCGISTTIDAVLGVALIAIAVVAVIRWGKKVRAILSFLGLVIGVFAALVPTVIVGTCPHAHMACHVVTGPVLAVTGAVIALFEALNLGYLKLKRRNEQDEF